MCPHASFLDRDLLPITKDDSKWVRFQHGWGVGKLCRAEFRTSFTRRSWL